METIREQIIIWCLDSNKPGPHFHRITKSWSVFG
jgi:hypothetical protein